jgi:ectoine hydroxylase-related dioxygenase (phytanoyl-CoA dioxygenase family)
MKAGSFLLYNLFTFHANGVNSNGEQRRCMDNVLYKLFMKTQFQWDQALMAHGYKDHLSEGIRKPLGFHKNPAPSLEAYDLEAIN